ncbi:MAG: alpha/beta fold hydrolase [Alphaproteobacteria bacterium]
MPLPVVFVPGLLCTGALFADQILGLGGTRGVHIGDVTRHENVSEMAAHVLASAPPCFDLVGLSMGGYVSFEILRQAPDRVDKLVLMDTSARADSTDQAKRRAELIDQSSFGTFKGVTPRLLPLLIHKSRLDDESVTSVVLQMAADVGQAGFVRQQRALLARPDSRGDLKGITQNTLIIVGDEDAITPPKLAREMAELLPDARLEIVPTCGHLAPLEQPDITTDLLLDFLD